MSSCNQRLRYAFASELLLWSNIPLCGSTQYPDKAIASSSSLVPSYLGLPNQDIGFGIGFCQGQF